MAYIGKVPTAVPLTSSDLEDNIITSAKIVDGTIATADISDGAVTSVKTTGVGGANTPFFNATLSSSSNINDSTTTKINFDTVKTESSSGIFDTTNFRFTVPSGQAGNYEITLKVRVIDTENNMVRTDFYIYKNGSALSQFGGLTTGTDQDLRGIDSCCSVILDLAVGDYIEGYLYVDTTDSGTTILYGNSGWETYLSGFKLVE